jgi:hypothetical protein
MDFQGMPLDRKGQTLVVTLHLKEELPLPAK